jgi:hypothetical protein
VRKRRGLDAAVDAFVRHVYVVVSFVRHVDIVGSCASGDTDADTYGGTDAHFGYTVNDGGACSVPGGVVLPADEWGEVL